MIGFQTHPFIVPIFLSAIVAAGIGFLTWRRGTTSSRLLGFMAASICLWSAAYGLELMHSTKVGMTLLANIKYVGIVTSPVFLFLFTLSYVGAQRFLNRKVIAGLFVVPLILVLLLWTNDWHQLHYLSIDVAVVDGYSLRAVTPGIGYWLNALYAYALILISVLLLLYTYLTTDKLYKSQIFLMLVGIVIPWIGSMVYVFAVGSGRTVDFTPITFTISGAIVTVGYLRFYLFDLMPVARSRLVETMLDAWVVLDGKNRFVDLNSAAQALIDEPKEKILGAPVETVLAADHPLLAILTTNKKDTELDIYLDDALHTYAVRFTPLDNGSRQTNDRLIVLHDISARKRAETALRILNASLEKAIANRTAQIRAEKERSETILNTIDEGIVLVDRVWSIHYANRGMVRLTGFDQTQLLQMTLHDLPLWEGAQSWEALTQTLLDKETWQGELHLQQNNGRIATCLLSTATVHTKTGQIDSYVLIFRDISHLKRLEQARHQFITNISHELRTPITNLKLYLDLLETTTPTIKDSRYAAVLQEQTDRLAALAQAIVDLAKLDSSHGIRHWQTITAHELVQPLVDSFQTTAVAREVTLTVVETDTDDLLFWGRIDLLQRALLELVKNAVNYAPPGGLVTISSRRECINNTRWTTLAVTDTGPGLSREEQEKIYERFYRGAAADSGNIPGFGLGLSIAWEIMKAHGGHVSVSSAPGAGSTFTLWLPTPNTAVPE